MTLPWLVLLLGLAAGVALAWLLKRARATAPDDDEAPLLDRVTAITGRSPLEMFTDTEGEQEACETARKLFRFAAPSIEILEVSTAAAEDDPRDKFARRRALIVKTSKGTFTQDIECIKEGLVAAPFVALVNEALGAHGIRERLLQIGYDGDQPLAYFATGDGATAARLQRAGLLTEPFELPAEQVAALPCKPGTRARLHPNAVVEHAVLAEDSTLQGFPCAGGSAVELDEHGRLRAFVLAAPRTWGGLTFPRGTAMTTWEDGKAPLEATLSAEITLGGVRFPEGSTIEFEEDGTPTWAITGADIDIPLPSSPPEKPAGATAKGTPYRTRGPKGAATITCKKGACLDFCDGRFELRRAALSGDQVIAGIPCLADDDATFDVYFHANGSLEQAVLARDFARGGATYTRLTKLSFDEEFAVIRASSPG